MTSVFREQRAPLDQRPTQAPLDPRLAAEHEEAMAHFAAVLSERFGAKPVALHTDLGWEAPRDGDGPHEGAEMYPLTGDRDEEECRRDPRVLLVLAAMDVSEDVTDLLSGLSPAALIDRAQQPAPAAMYTASDQSITTHHPARSNSFEPTIERPLSRRRRRGGNFSRDSDGRDPIRGAL